MKKLAYILILMIFATTATGQVRDTTRSTLVTKSTKLFKVAMSKGVASSPLITYPDDYILPNSKTDRTLPEELQPYKITERLDCVVLKPKQITISNSKPGSYRITAMENVGNETYVTYTLPIFADGQWHAMSKNRIMTDLSTGDRYFPRRMLNGIPMDKILIIRDKKSLYIDLTVVYPLLSPKARMVTFSDIRPIQTELPLNRSPRSGPVTVDAKQMLERSKNKPRDIF